MLKKIFLGLIFLVIVVLIINKVSASSRVRATGFTNSIGKFKIAAKNAQQYQPVETKIQVLPPVKIPIKSKAVKVPTKSKLKEILTKTKKLTKTRKHRITHYTSRIHYTSRYGTTLRWDAVSLRYLSNIAFFDYSYFIRAKTIKKIESYARRHHISVVTMSMMNTMTK